MRALHWFTCQPHSRGGGLRATTTLTETSSSSLNQAEWLSSDDGYDFGCPGAPQAGSAKALTGACAVVGTTESAR